MEVAAFRANACAALRPRNVQNAPRFGTESWPSDVLKCVASVILGLGRGLAPYMANDSDANAENDMARCSDVARAFQMRG